MNEASGEYSMARTYLDTLLALPWSKLDEESIDIARARNILDADHYGLEKIKKRIVEYLAVRKLNPEGRSPILCFVAAGRRQDLARAEHRPLARAQVPAREPRRHARRGRDPRPPPHLHRRAAGNIIQAPQEGRHRQPGADARRDRQARPRHTGGSASALLEVLDPEQNSTFRDNYLGVPFDLSKVLFIATANQLDTIPGPLRDRMEIIELTGYTEEEKVEIARRYLVRRQLEANGLKPEQAVVTDEALRHIARDYTREAGCRNLEREIGAVLRNVAVRIAEGKVADRAHRRAGGARDPRRAALRERGGDARQRAGSGDRPRLDARGRRILFIEANAHPGQGRADPHRAARRRE